MSVPYDRECHGSAAGGCSCNECGVTYIGAEWQDGCCAVCERAASVDTHPKDGNSTEIEVPLVSGAVGEAETPKGGSHA